MDAEKIKRLKERLNKDFSFCDNISNIIIDYIGDGTLHLYKKLYCDSYIQCLNYSSDGKYISIVEFRTFDHYCVKIYTTEAWEEVYKFSFSHFVVQSWVKSKNALITIDILGDMRLTIESEPNVFKDFFYRSKIRPNQNVCISSFNFVSNNGQEYPLVSISFGFVVNIYYLDDSNLKYIDRFEMVENNGFICVTNSHWTKNNQFCLEAIYEPFFDGKKEMLILISDVVTEIDRHGSVCVKLKKNIHKLHGIYWFGQSISEDEHRFFYFDDKDSTVYTKKLIPHQKYIKNMLIRMNTCTKVSELHDEKGRKIKKGFNGSYIVNLSKNYSALEDVNGNIYIHVIGKSKCIQKLEEIKTVDIIRKPKPGSLLWSPCGNIFIKFLDNRIFVYKLF
jgi:hypothetical protein